MKSKKVKHLKKGELRVIQIDRDAVYELVRETMIDYAQTYFDIIDITKVHFQWQWNSQTDQLICVICDGNYMPDLDLAALGKQVGITTPSLYCPSRYKTIYVSKEEVDTWARAPISTEKDILKMMQK